MADTDATSPPALSRAQVQTRESQTTGWWERLWAAVFAGRFELAALALGMGLRVVVRKTFVHTRGYDFYEHWKHITWFRDHFSVPPPNLSRTAYHAPLFHFLAGKAFHFGVGPQGIQTSSTVIACLRLVLLAVGLRLILPSSRRARVLALTVAAVLPCSVHLDAMVTQEPLSNMLAVAIVVLILMVFRTRPPQRWGWALFLGIVTGLSLLTKVSGLILAATVAIAGPIEMAMTPALGARERLRRLAPWVMAFLVALLVGGWWYLRSYLIYGKAFISGWDFMPYPQMLAVNAEAHPLFDRRTIGYVLGWSSDIYQSPYYPAASGVHPRFFPVLVASTFVDYYMYGFGRDSLAALSTVARLSIAGGTVIAAITSAGWLGIVAFLVRRREAAPLVLLALPALGLLGQLLFAIRYPYEFEGVVKGIYYHFSTSPLCGVFGVAVAWLWGRRRGALIARPIALLAMLSIAGVASYTFYSQWI